MPTDTNGPIYGVSARSYLKRARDRLLENSREGLFYAALELRCCVENRQAEYIEHLLAYKGRKLQPFKVGENREKIARITGGEVIAMMTFQLPDKQIFTGYHTPVPRSLIEYCQRHLDNLRHAQSQFRNNDDPWWHEIRNMLVSNYRLAWVACQGNMLVPPLWSKNGTAVHPMIFELHDENHKLLEQMKNSKGSTFAVKIEYLDTPPNEWVCDL